ncbi:MAG: hypothetical protein QM589_10120 [Thermomicrobiales bacterium]
MTVVGGVLVALLLMGRLTALAAPEASPVAVDPNGAAGRSPETTFEAATPLPDLGFSVNGETGSPVYVDPAGSVTFLVNDPDFVALQLFSSPTCSGTGFLTSSGQSMPVSVLVSIVGSTTIGMQTTDYERVSECRVLIAQVAPTETPEPSPTEAVVSLTINGSSSNAVSVYVDDTVQVAWDNVYRVNIYSGDICSGPATGLYNGVSSWSLAATEVEDSYGNPVSFQAVDWMGQPLTTCRVLTITETPPVTATEVPPTSTVAPTATETVEPTSTQTAEPTATETAEPTSTATPLPTATETVEPTATATIEPTATVTVEPTSTPIAEPTATETTAPTATETTAPTATETTAPTSTETAEPTATETSEPTATAEPTVTATTEPTTTETAVPTSTETVAPTATETVEPTSTETVAPTATETVEPTSTETVVPTATTPPAPTATVTVMPSATPTATAEAGDLNIIVTTANGGDIPAGAVWLLARQGPVGMHGAHVFGAAALTDPQGGTLTTALPSGSALPVANPVAYGTYILSINAPGYEPFSVVIEHSADSGPVQTVTATLITQAAPTATETAGPPSPTTASTATVTATTPTLPAPVTATATSVVSDLPNTGAGNGEHGTWPVLLMAAIAMTLLGLGVGLRMRRDR